MTKFQRSERQAIIDGYLNETGRNIFHPAEFVDWLSGQPEHQAYEMFFGQTDQQAARQHRISMARRMASGLRVTVSVTPPKVASVKVKVRDSEFPAYISPVASRQTGGGYTAFDPKSEADQHELARQGATALISWLQRYQGVAHSLGVNVDAIGDIAKQLAKSEEEAA